MKWTFLSLLLCLLCACGKVREPEFRRVENFGLRKLDLTEAGIGFRVTYFNPNSFGVTIKDAVADVYLDSVFLGKFSQDSAVVVKKNAEFSIPFSGNVSLKTVLNLKFEDLVDKDVFLKAEGSAKVGKAGIYVTKPIHYQGKNKLDINL